MSSETQAAARSWETHATDRWHLEDVAKDTDEPDVDAIATRTVEARSTGAALRPGFRFAGAVSSGSRIGCKVCQRRIADGQTTRLGRWYLSRREVEAVDALALGVYHESDGAIIGSATTLLPVDAVARVLPAFVDSPHRDYEQVCRPPWSVVFDPEVVDRA